MGTIHDITTARKYIEAGWEVITLRDGSMGLKKGRTVLRIAPEVQREIEGEEPEPIRWRGTKGKTS